MCPPSARRRRRRRGDGRPRGSRTASKGVEDRERGVHRRPLLFLGAAGARETEQRRCLSRGVVKQVRSLELRSLGELWLEELAHDPERELAFQLRPARAKHAHACVCRGAARGGEQRRLTDSGRPFDDQEPSASGAGVGQRRFDARQLLAPLEQRLHGRGAAHSRRGYAYPAKKSGGSPRCESHPARSSIEPSDDELADELTSRRRWLL